VARIDAPQLSKLDVTFFNAIIFDTPQFIQFIRRTSMLKPLKKLVLPLRVTPLRSSSHHRHLATKPKNSR
jgi:hypothetical protein